MSGNLMVCVGVFDVKFGERKYTALTTTKYSDPNEIPQRERIGGYFTEEDSNRTFNEISGLVYHQLAHVFATHKIKDKSEVDTFPINNLGSEFFGEHYRPFSEEELQFLRDKLFKHVQVIWGRDYL